MIGLTEHRQLLDACKALLHAFESKVKREERLGKYNDVNDYKFIVAAQRAIDASKAVLSVGTLYGKRR